jgi:hypothetical protein
VFLVLSGIHYFLDMNSLFGKMGGLFVSQTDKTVGIVIGILKIVSGAVLVVGPFGLLAKGIRQLAFWIIVIFWLVMTVYLAAAGAGALKNGAGEVLAWFEALFLNIAVLAALWSLNPNDQ